MRRVDSKRANIRRVHTSRRNMIRVSTSRKRNEKHKDKKEMVQKCKFEQEVFSLTRNIENKEDKNKEKRNLFLKECRKT